MQNDPFGPAKKLDSSSSSYPGADVQTSPHLQPSPHLSLSLWILRSVNNHRCQQLQGLCQTFDACLYGHVALG